MKVENGIKKVRPDSIPKQVVIFNVNNIKKIDIQQD